MGGVAGARKLRLVVQARADDQPVRVIAPGTQQRRRIVRVMLSVAIQGDDASCAMSLRFGEGESKTGSLAPVQRMSEQRQGQALQLQGSRVGGSIIDDDQPGTQRQ